MISVSELDSLEEQIRANKAPKIQDLIRTIKPQEVPRSLLARYANLLRRMGGAQYAIKLLNPLVRGKIAKPSASEIIEYAACLTRLGLEEESISLLAPLRNETDPEILYELAAAHMSKWSFSGAIPYLKKYIQSKELNPYKICVGELNLAASYINTQELEAAEVLLKKILIGAKKNGFELIMVNALELLGEVALLRQIYKTAKKYFTESGEKLKSPNPRYHVYLEKWLVIVRLIEECGTKDSLAEWAKVRKKAAKAGIWNSIRELELFKAVVTKDIKALTYLYYGVPFPEFRLRILNIWGKPFKVSAHYERQIGPRSETAEKVFDVALGRDMHTGSQLKPGFVLHRLLQVLVSDFYSPFLTTKLFSAVFQGAIYNPVTSPQQVYESIKRLNEWFKESQIPFEVQYTNSGYRLRASEAYILRIPNNIDLGLRTKVDDFLDKLRHHGLIENFTLKMVVDKLGLPPRTASRLLSESHTCGKLIRKGKNKTTTYSINLAKAAA